MWPLCTSTFLRSEFSCDALSYCVSIWNICNGIQPSANGWKLVCILVPMRVLLLLLTDMLQISYIEVLGKCVHEFDAQMGFWLSVLSQMPITFHKCWVLSSKPWYVGHVYRIVCKGSRLQKKQKEMLKCWILHLHRTIFQILCMADLAEWR